MFVEEFLKPINDRCTSRCDNETIKNNLKKEMYRFLFIEMFV